LGIGLKKEQAEEETDAHENMNEFSARLCGPAETGTQDFAEGNQDENHPEKSSKSHPFVLKQLEPWQHGRECNRFNFIPKAESSFSAHFFLLF
jgi:hypothetical protein